MCVHLQLVRHASNILEALPARGGAVEDEEFPPRSDQSFRRKIQIQTGCKVETVKKDPRRTVSLPIRRKQQTLQAEKAFARSRAQAINKNCGLGEIERRNWNAYLCMGLARTGDREKKVLYRLHIVPNARNSRTPRMILRLIAVTHICRQTGATDRQGPHSQCYYCEATDCSIG